MTVPWGRLAGAWGAPPNGFAWGCFGFGIACWLAAVLPYRWLPSPPLLRRHAGPLFIIATCILAAALSTGYIIFILKGGPRIIDATTYFLQARALSEGHFRWPVPFPTESFRGRFLLFTAPNELAGIFPPGYPLVLAAGFVFGNPMAVGPVVAAMLVGATYILAYDLTGLDPHREPSERKSIARTAALLSAGCAALRYHTADTMAHGATALGIACAVIAIIRAGNQSKLRLTLIGCVASGLSAGFVFSTRPVSFIPLAFALTLLAFRIRRAIVAVLAGVAGWLPGALLLAWAQHSATGSWLTSTQLSYYATSDGPPGCFRYGLGEGIGCLLEHGDFVRAQLGDGHGWRQALLATLRRAHHHLLDIANAEPIALLGLGPLFVQSLRGRKSFFIPAGMVVAHTLAYAPFYFDGNYPGGGARLFADVLPLEHVALAVAWTWLLGRLSFEQRSLVLAGAMSLGFAIHASFGHLQLGARDGGRPMFEPSALAAAGIHQGLIYFDTDHGFNLAHDPAQLRSGVIAARTRGDAHDTLLYEALGRPPAYTYRRDPTGPTLQPWSPEPSLRTNEWRFEFESEWPPLGQSDGWVEPAWASGTCASASRMLTLHAREGDASVRVSLAIPEDGTYRVTPYAFRLGTGGHARLGLFRSDAPEASGEHPWTDGLPQAEWTWSDGDDADSAPCVALPAKVIPLLGRSAVFVWQTSAPTSSLDRVTLELAHR